MATAFRHALIIGASSGMGAALARRLTARGARVALVARRRDELERLATELNAARADCALPFPHDVRHWQEVPELLQRIARDLGGLDLVVYAAGIMPRSRRTASTPPSTATCWRSTCSARWPGSARSLTVSPGSGRHHRRHRLGLGDRGRTANPAYGTSKAGLHTYLEALRNRVSRHGVRVVTIKPGFVDTPMTRGLHGLFWLISSDRAAAIIHRKAARGAVTAYVPARWRLVMWVIRSIPSVIFRRLKV